MNDAGARLEVEVDRGIDETGRNLLWAVLCDPFFLAADVAPEGSVLVQIPSHPARDRVHEQERSGAVTDAVEIDGSAIPVFYLLTVSLNGAG